MCMCMCVCVCVRVCPGHYLLSLQSCSGLHTFTHVHLHVYSRAYLRMWACRLVKSPLLDLSPSSANC